MNEPASLDAAVDLGATSTTPTGTQSMAELRNRRWFVFGVNAATYAGLALWMASILGTGGFALVDGILFLLPGRHALDGARVLERRFRASGSCTAAGMAWLVSRPSLPRATARSRSGAHGDPHDAPQRGSRPGHGPAQDRAGEPGCDGTRSARSPISS